MNQKEYEYWLSNVPGAGWKTIRRLLDALGTPEEIYKASAKALEPLLRPKVLEALLALRNAWDLSGEYEKLDGAGIRFCTISDPCYPERLGQIPDPPYALFWKGALPEHGRPAVAVVGARNCSEYGRFVARALGEAFAEAGVQLISGMAKGIDGISQQAALEGGGRSYAVLGCGVDICYPSQNRLLYERLCLEGGVLSTYPPGTPPQASLFPPRNRIVSGLADAVIVVEARQKSGTLITVDMALEQGKEVYVVPGRLTDRLSDGCNKLIWQGASILLSPQDFLRELRQLCPEKSFCASGEADDSSGEGKCVCPGDSGREEGASREMSAQEQVLAALDFYPLSVSQIRERMSVPLTYQQTLVELMGLCLKGAAVQTAAGYFHRAAESEIPY